MDIVAENAAETKNINITIHLSGTIREFIDLITELEEGYINYELIAAIKNGLS